jgi:hypothetical protein
VIACLAKVKSAGGSGSSNPNNGASSSTTTGLAGASSNEPKLHVNFRDSKLT